MLPAASFTAVVEHPAFQAVQAYSPAAAAAASHIVTGYVREKLPSGGCGAEMVGRLHGGLRWVGPGDALCWISAAVAAGLVQSPTSLTSGYSSMGSFGAATVP